MSQAPEVHTKVRKAAHWLTGQLFDELALENAADMEPHFAMWMSGFRIVIENMYQEAEPTTFLLFACSQAKKYYAECLEQRQHTEYDQVWYQFVLSWGLLMGCDYFADKSRRDPFADDNPQDFLTLEGLHFGYFASLIDAVDAMLHGQGTQVTGFSYKACLKGLPDYTFSDN